MISKLATCSVVILLAAGSAAPLRAQELTWDDVLSQTKANNPALKKAEASLAQAKSQYYRSYSSFLPQISASGGAGQGDSDTSGFSRDFSLGLSASLSLFSGFGDISEVSVRDLDVKAARANYERAVSDAIYAARRGFIDLLWAQEALVLSRQILKRRVSNYEMIRLRYEAGTEDRGSLLRIEADRFQAEYDVNRAQRAMEDASLRLVTAIGRDDFEVVSVTGTLAVRPSAPPRLPEALAGVPEYRVAQYRFEQSKLSVTAARSSLYPDLSLSASRSRSGPGWVPDRDRWGVNLSLSYSLFAGGRNIFDIRIAESGRAAAEQSFREARQQLAVRVDAAATAFADALENIGVRERYLSASREQSDITSARYINGLTSYQDWYTIENDFIGAERALLNARRDAALADGQLRNVLGRGEQQ